MNLVVSSSTDKNTVAVSNHEAFLLPSSESLSYIENIPRSSLYSDRKLADDDRDNHRDCSLQ